MTFDYFLKSLQKKENDHALTLPANTAAKNNTKKVKQDSSGKDNIKKTESVK